MGVKFTPLKIINNSEGSVMHALKKSSSMFNEFGEAYFSTVNYGQIKKWRKHNKYTCNLIVPVGSIKLSVIDVDASLIQDTLIYTEYVLSPENYGCLTIPPGYWFKIEGKGYDLNLLLNIIDGEHDDSEVVSMPAHFNDVHFFNL
jgi:dTDP-4-dehydrorhamnose 3,5-epimerase